jgi:apolipoprotein N-acyltransferase
VSEGRGIFPLAGGLAFSGAAVAGLAYWVSFAGMNQWYLAFVCFAPFYVVLQGQTAKRATWLGLVTGLAMTLGGFYWLLEMLKTFSGFPTPLCMLFVVILCAYQAGRLAMMGWLHARASARGWPAPFVFIGAFATSELAFPLLFPWYFAASVHQVTVLAQIAEIGGPILVGVVLALVNVALGELMVAILERRALDKKVTATAAGALAFTLVWGMWRISAVKADIEKAEPLHVGLVQGNMGLMQKREDPAEGLRRHIRLTKELRQNGVELVVWSESSVTIPVHESRYKDFMRMDVGSRLGIPGIVGGVIYRRDPDRERWFNSAVSTSATGEVLSRYDKHYLLMFGEYLPLGDTFPILYKWSPNSGKFSSGNTTDPLVVPVNGKDHKVTVLICYEDILPGFTNRAVVPETELLVNMTNDAWFGDTTEPWEHLALATFRAIEHRRYLVRSTNSGISAIIDPLGRVLKHTEAFKAQSLEETVRWMKASTVYEKIGDAPWYIVALATCTMAFAKRRKREQAS